MQPRIFRNKRASKKECLPMVIFHILSAHLRATIWLSFAREYNYYKLFILSNKAIRDARSRSKNGLRFLVLVCGEQSYEDALL